MQWSANRVGPDDAEDLVMLLEAIRNTYGTPTLLHLAVTAIVADAIGLHASERVFILGDYSVTCRRDIGGT